jgi:hypothetical protein
LSWEKHAIRGNLKIFPEEYPRTVSHGTDILEVLKKKRLLLVQEATG